MSFSAKLSLDSKSYRVLQFEMEFIQPTGQYGEPVAAPRATKLSLVVETTKSDVFIQWMLNHTMKKEGYLVFNRRDSESEMKRVTFKDALCVHYREVFDFNNDNPMLIHLGLSARWIQVSDNATWEVEWNNFSGGGGAGSSSKSSGSQPAGEVSSFIPD